MARPPRIVFPGQPLHILQRGNNRTACFFADEDCRAYLDYLHEATQRYDCRIHACVRYVNAVYRRRGTLWEGRYKSALVPRAAT